MADSPAERPNVNPTPKQEFQANGKFISLHREMMQQPMLQVSIQYALLQYQRLQCEQRLAEYNAAAMNHFKMQGALEFIAVLKNLAEMPVKPTTKIDHSKLSEL